MAIRVGVVGIGFMGKAHIGIHARNPRAKVVAFCDTDPKKAAGDWGGGGGNIGDQSNLGVDPKALRSHRTPQDLYTDPEVDLVDICLPTYLHAANVVKALAAGKHVLCEKPLAVSLKEADLVIQAVKKAKGFMMPAHCMRFWPEWQWLKAAVAEKRFGKVLSAVFRRFGSTPVWSWGNWLLEPRLSGSALFDLHIHDIDFVRYVFGEPQAVFAVGTAGKATREGMDHVVATYLYRNPRQVVMAEGGWEADPSYGFTMRYTVVFDRATADFDLAREGKTLQLHKAGRKEPEVIKVPATNGWEQEIEYFLTCIEKGTPPKVTTAADARKSVALAHAELESIKKRKIVKL
ncbi:MAG: Gfo/Idh/MocA family oxidoreductase [Planctomycetota bacterium]|nr:Gfo/Idh/MocA family oxidoreductase [Planctomycetota bacterium]